MIQTRQNCTNEPCSLTQSPSDECDVKMRRDACSVMTILHICYVIDKVDGFYVLVAFFPFDYGIKSAPIALMSMKSNGLNREKLAIWLNDAFNYGSFIVSSEVRQWLCYNQCNRNVHLHASILAKQWSTQQTPLRWFVVRPLHCTIMFARQFISLCTNSKYFTRKWCFVNGDFIFDEKISHYIWCSFILYWTLAVQNAICIVFALHLAMEISIFGFPSHLLRLYRFIALLLLRRDTTHTCIG